DGGFVHKEIAGLVLNNCDDRIDPATGVFFDLYGVGSSTALLSSYSYVHATARLAGYATPFRKFDRLVVFGRLLVDYLRGGAPFYEYENTVGFSPEEIFGGEGSMRGIPEYRFRDRFSFVITPECRLRAFPFSLFGTDYNLGPVVFSDIGNTFPSPLLMKPVLYVTYGTGLRLRWDHDFVATLQFAFWKNTLGGVYLSFDEQY
ncbi:MAG TPA: hypothetical protein VLX68_15255, partial [Chitinivibrionales bacterium]|nr:hypothetical protein [Chitinivibrionales bacterium]